MCVKKDRKMSILNYFRKGKANVENSQETLPYIAGSAGLSSREFSLVTEELQNLSSEKKLVVAGYAHQYGPSRTVAKYLKHLPKLN